MYFLIVSILLNAVGLPGNIMLLYVTSKNFKKVTFAELLIIHLSVANMMQLISQILAITLPDQYDVCHPISLSCKFTIVVLYCGKKLSIWFTLLLGVVHLIKLTRRNRTIITRSTMHCALALSWIVWVTVSLPYVLIIPNNRIRNNSSGYCVCSFLNALIDTDVFIKTFDIILGFVAPVVAVILMCVVNIKILWILLKHQQTVFTDGTLHGYRSNQREIKAIKGITALVISFVTCNLINSFLRDFPSHIVNDIRKIVGDIYPAFSPFILGLGYQRFRQKFMCTRCYIICNHTKVKQISTVS